MSKVIENIYLPITKCQLIDSHQDTIQESSLLVKIINKVDAMSNNEQHALWLRLNQKEILEKARVLDEGIGPSNLTEDEIVALCKYHNQS